MGEDDTPRVRIATRRIVDWDSFHTAFAEAFGFPAFYGRNMNAWIDCMTYLDDPDAGMSSVHCARGDVVTIVLDDAADFASRCPEIHAELSECVAFVNERRVGCGEPAVLALEREPDALVV